MSGSGRHVANGKVVLIQQVKVQEVLVHEMTYQCTVLLVQEVSVQELTVQELAGSVMITNVFDVLKFVFMAGTSTDFIFQFYSSE